MEPLPWPAAIGALGTGLKLPARRLPRGSWGHWRGPVARVKDKRPATWQGEVPGTFRSRTGLRRRTQS